MTKNVAEAESEQDCLESDLQLAAELGKTLLERNKELEISLKQQQDIIDDQVLNINFLTKQVVALQDVNDSRLKVYEQLELNVQELEKHKQRLQHEAKADKDRIQRLSSNVEILEARCDHLQVNIEELQQQERKKRDRRQTIGMSSYELPELRRVISIDNGFLDRIQSFSEIPYETEIQRLQDKVKRLKAQLNREHRHCDELEIELAFLTEENEALQLKVSELEGAKIQATTLQVELEAMEMKYNKLCKSYKNNDSYIPESDFEDDSQDLSNCEVFHLKNGGKGYGSEESLSMAGLEPVEQVNVSLLGELDEKYHNLVEKYEALLNSRTKTAGKSDDFSNKAIQTDITEHFIKENLDPTEGRFETSPPEYKKLFREIFNVLKRPLMFGQPSTSADCESSSKDSDN